MVARANFSEELRDLSAHMLGKMDILFDGKSTSEWPKGIKIDTADLGPRVTDQQEIGLRLSHGMDCDRVQWYKHNEPQFHVPPPAMIQLEKFSVGDLWEAYSHGILPHCMPTDWTYINAKNMEITLRGIKGHLDGLIINKKKKWLIISDSKASSGFRHKKWTEGHKPDEPWGNWNQAANYCYAMDALCRRDTSKYHGYKVIGFVWPALVTGGFGWDLAAGWATRQDIEPWHKKTQDSYRRAKSLASPPIRWQHTNVCKYCNFRQHCKKDSR